MCERVRLLKCNAVMVCMPSQPLKYSVSDCLSRLARSFHARGKHEIAGKMKLLGVVQVGNLSWLRSFLRVGLVVCPCLSS